MSMNVRIRMVVVPINVPMTGALIIVNAHQDMNLTSTTEHVLVSNCLLTNLELSPCNGLKCDTNLNVNELILRNSKLLYSCVIHYS